MAYVVGITGASGSVYGLRLLQALHQLGAAVDAVVTEIGAQVLAYECGVTLEDLAQYATIYANNDLFAPPASGSCGTDGMVIAPCSMNTLGMIACGVCPNLLTRAATVALKERRKLVLVPRETPLSVIHLENMHKLALAGAVVLPAAPGFYTQPNSIEELVDGIVSRILDQLGLKHEIAKRWKGGDKR